MRTRRQFSAETGSDGVLGRKNPKNFDTTRHIPGQQPDRSRAEHDRSPGERDRSREEPDRSAGQQTPGRRRDNRRTRLDEERVKAAACEARLDARLVAKHSTVAATPTAKLA
jgi:hypothetical protein